MQIDYVSKFPCRWTWINRIIQQIADAEYMLKIDIKYLKKVKIENNKFPLLPEKLK